MLMTMQDLAHKFRTLIGDSSKSVPDNLIIEGINTAFNTLANVPGLARAFRKHYQVDLNAKDGCKWKLEGDFRRLADIPMLNFYTTGEGGDPCKLTVCPVDTVAFYNKNGLVTMKQAGIPCEYTIEQQDDDTFLVLDRPSDVPILVDYIAYGYPEPVYDFEHPKLDEKGNIMTDALGNVIMEPTIIEISAVIENGILNAMRQAFFAEAEDLAFAGAVMDTLTNKEIPEMVQMLNKRLGTMGHTIIGEQ